jgi:hypothetical protein
VTVGGGGGPVPSTPASPPSPAPTTAAPTTAPTTAPTAAPPAAPDKPAVPGKEWAPGVAYRTDDEVTYRGVTYKCRQSHSSIRSWEPSIFTLALWLPL